MKQRRVNQDPYGGDGIDIDVVLDTVSETEDPIVHVGYENMMSFGAPTFEHSQAILRLEQISGHLAGPSSWKR